MDKMQFTLVLEQHATVSAVPGSITQHNVLHNVLQQRPPLVARVEVHIPASVLDRGKLTPRAGPAAVMVFNALTPHFATVGLSDSPGSHEAAVLAAYQPVMEDGSDANDQAVDISSFR